MRHKKSPLSSLVANSYQAKRFGKLFALGIAPLGLLACAGLLPACSGAERDISDESGEEIRGGTSAKNFPEAVLIVSETSGGDLIPGTSCSGALVAPKVVLTAAACLHGPKWRVDAPYASSGISQTATATSAKRLSTSTDIGLIFLNSKIQFSKCPTLATKAEKVGTTIHDIGRDMRSRDMLMVSKPIKILSVQSRYYTAADVTQPFDRGGAVEPVGSHELAAVISKDTFNNRDLLARVDVYATEIEKEISAHGGGCDTSSTDAGAAHDGDTPDAAGDGAADNDAGNTDGGDYTTTDVDASSGFDQTSNPSFTTPDDTTEDAGPTLKNTFGQSGGCSTTGAPVRGSSIAFFAGLGALVARWYRRGSRRRP